MTDVKIPARLGTKPRGTDRPRRADHDGRRLGRPPRGCAPAFRDTRPTWWARLDCTRRERLRPRPRRDRVASCGAAAPSSGSRMLPPARPPQRRHPLRLAGLVDIGGDRELYLECRGTGSPRCSSSRAHSVPPTCGHPPARRRGRRRRDVRRLAETTRVCAYDRPGPRSIGSRPHPPSRAAHDRAASAVDLPPSWELADHPLGAPGHTRRVARPGWVAAQALLAESLRATHITETDSGHGLPVEQPALVTDAILSSSIPFGGLTPTSVQAAGRGRDHAVGVQVGRDILQRRQRDALRHRAVGDAGDAERLVLRGARARRAAPMTLTLRSPMPSTSWRVTSAFSDPGRRRGRRPPSR